ncbi:MAG: hypothetical protein ACOX6T_16790 [Myxococcales bacterium]|jgi:NADH:ubiquinone oxidoreductase subunit 6 (subunit J)
MAEFYLMGGWGMYPTTLFGLMLVAAGIAYAVLPERRFVPLLVSMGVVVFGSGMLGTVTGFINTFRYIEKVPEAQQRAITLVGVSESLNNLVLAFIFIVLATLLASVGALRLGLRSRSEKSEHRGEPSTLV